VSDYKTYFEMKQDDWIEACAEIDKLRADLAVAVEALKVIHRGDWLCLCRNLSTEALQKIEGK
jgi:hypothetical protein